MTGTAAAVIWLVVAVILCVIEGMTTQLVCIWFAAGALAAMMVSFLHAPEWLQLLVFLAVSVAVLVIGRPFLRRRVEVRKQPTNADRVIGMTGVITEEVDNLKQSGRVSADGLDWTARAIYDGMVLPVHTLVIVRAIVGVKLIVEPLEQYAPNIPDPR